MIPQPVAVIGATGRSGAALLAALLAEGVAAVPVVRNTAKWRARGLPGTPRIAAIEDGAALGAALAGCAAVVSCAHARHAPAILAAAPPEACMVLLGSTRKFTRWPDAHGLGVAAGEAAFLASGRRGIMLHPTMIYGAQGEDNVRRLARLLRRLPVLPLPAGGAALVQPIYQDDVTRSILAALREPWEAAESLVIAGPEPLPYRRFIAAVARAAGIPHRPVVPVPGALLVALARVGGRALGVGADEVRRLMEDKAFDIAPMRARLGIAPVPLETGLARTFGEGAE